MKVSELIEELKKYDRDADVMLIAQSNPCGNIWNCFFVRPSTYGFLGLELPCVILDHDCRECGKCEDCKGEDEAKDEQ